MKGAHKKDIPQLYVLLLVKLCVFVSCFYRNELLCQPDREKKLIKYISSRNVHKLLFHYLIINVSFYHIIHTISQRILYSWTTFYARKYTINFIIRFFPFTNVLTMQPMLFSPLLQYQTHKLLFMIVNNVNYIETFNSM